MLLLSPMLGASVQPGIPDRVNSTCHSQLFALMEHGPLSSAATAGPIRAHHRARPLPDRKGTRITRQDGGIWWTWTESNRRHSACRADALPTELQARNLEAGRRFPAMAKAQGLHPARDLNPDIWCWRPALYQLSYANSVRVWTCTPYCRRREYGVHSPETGRIHK